MANTMLRRVEKTKMEAAARLHSTREILRMSRERELEAWDAAGAARGSQEFVAARLRYDVCVAESRLAEWNAKEARDEYIAAEQMAVGAAVDGGAE